MMEEDVDNVDRRSRKKRADILRERKDKLKMYDEVDD